VAGAHPGVEGAGPGQAGANQPAEKAVHILGGEVMMDKLCKNCKHWKRVEEEGEWIRSICPKAFAGIDDYLGDDMVLLQGWQEFDVPDYFGCIHFESKPKPINWKYLPGA